MSGVAQFVAKHGMSGLKEWCEDGYNTIQACDESFSDWLAIPRSIKTTSIKPSGTVSLLAGATPGMHWPESRYYIRRVRLSVHSPLLGALASAGYDIEPDVNDKSGTLVVSFPVDVGEGVRT
jgi:ribonucleoside-triphosphate reductase (thioredoxin)